MIPNRWRAAQVTALVVASLAAVALSPPAAASASTSGSASTSASSTRGATGSSVDAQSSSANSVPAPEEVRSRPHTQAQTSPLALDRISCHDNLHCIAVGSAGTAAVTTDGGRTWIMDSTGSSALLFGIDCVTNLRCWAVGEFGTIVTTSNGGASWTVQTSATSQFLYAISCPTSSDCWAAGDEGTVLVTTNGGSTWSAQSSGTDLTFFSLACPTTSECIGATNGGISETGDGGTNWIQASPGIPEGFFDVACPTASVCYAVGSGGAIIATTSGGASWSVQQDLDSALSYQYNNALWAVACTGATTCIVVGSSSTVETTSDGGNVWRHSVLPAQDLFLGVACTPASFCATTGSDSNILTTSDGGSTWSASLTASVPPGKSVKVMVVGDSVAFTLSLGLAAQAAWYGVSIDDRGVLGCGVTTGEPVVLSGQSVDVSGPCDGNLTASNPQLPQIWEQDVVTDRPQVVVVAAGHFEAADRNHDGTTMNITEPAYQAYVAAQLDLAARIFTSQGAHVVFLTSPYFSEPGPPGGGIYDQDQPGRIDEYNALVRQVADRYPGRVTVSDLNAKIDPGGAYAETIDGVQVRSPDGVHIQLSGGEWLAPWLLPQAAAQAPPSNATPDGYTMFGTDGNAYTFGSAEYYGSMQGKILTSPVVGGAEAADGQGYWEVASDGGIFAFGDAGFFGSMGGKALNRPIVGIAATPDGQGYWEVASDGGIFAFGDAGFFGSTGNIALAAPIVAMVADAATGGYWFVASDGGVFAFGSNGQTPFYGSAVGNGASPVVGMASFGGGFGYWVATADGHVYRFGSAPDDGSTGFRTAPVASIVPGP